MKQTVQKKNINSPIDTLIHVFRGQNVMFGHDLAKLYDVETKALNRAVQRNIERFPEDFMFQLTSKEAESSRPQIATLKMNRGQNIKYMPYVFTEQGVAMLSSVLHSPRAVEMNIQIIRAFVRTRQLILTSKEFAVRLEKLERNNESTSAVIEMLAEDIDKLSKDVHWIKNPPLKPKRRIGYIVGTEDEE